MSRAARAAFAATLAMVSLAVALPAAAGPGSPITAPAELDRLVNEIAAELDGFWGPVIDGAASDPPRRYEGPSGIEGYAAGDVPDTPCADSTGTAHWRDNARFCPADGTIWYDEGWFADLARTEGEYAPAAIVSHEWGHHLQTLLPLPSRRIAEELQADCFGGMYLAATEGTTVGDGRYVIEGEDLEAALRTFYSLGDTRYQASEWFQEDSHGSSQERFLAFSTGYTTGIGEIAPFGGLVNGLDWCLGYADFRPSAYTAIDPYRLLGPPGRPGTWEGDVYVIPPTRGAAYPMSELRLRWLPAAPGTLLSADEVGVSAALDRWLPGARPLYGVNPLVVDAGDAVTSYYEWRADGHVESGMAALLVPSSRSGGLLVLASRPRAAPPDEAPDQATWTLVLEQLLAADQVAARLCGPDASTDPRAGAFDATCLTDQQ